MVFGEITEIHKKVFKVWAVFKVILLQTDPAHSRVTLNLPFSLE